MRRSPVRCALVVVCVTGFAIACGPKPAVIDADPKPVEQPADPNPPLEQQPRVEPPNQPVDTTVTQPKEASPVPGGVVGGITGGVQAGFGGATAARIAGAMPFAAPPPFNTEAYDLVKDNGWKLAAQEPLSTFSADVDTAAYSNLRRFLNTGQRMPKDAVRIVFGYRVPLVL